MIIDTHSHIYLEDFDNDIEDVISRARIEGVEKICLPNIDSTSIEQMLKLEAEYPDLCKTMIGLHPTSVKENYVEELNLVEKLLTERQFIAIGEIGIDLYWDKTYKEQQIIAFKIQIELANKYNLPIAIHTRDSFDETFEILRKIKPIPKGVFHCFSGSYEQAKRATDLGFYLGIGGVITFKNAKLASTIQNIPLEKLLLETDAPFLTPSPFRGKRNEPSYLKYVVDKIAETKGITCEEVMRQTTKNAQALFGI